MSQIDQNNQMQTYQAGVPLYNYAVSTQPVQQSVPVTPQPVITAPYYQYPQTSIYNDPSKQQASGVNIYIYNPSAIGGQSSTSTANTTYAAPAPQVQPTVMMENPVSSQVAPVPAAPIANTPISQENTNTEGQKTKRIVELTDDYIKSLESYLRSSDADLRKNAITEIIKRFEEDNSRYDHPALTALLNIALQDPKPNNRLLAMSVIAGGSAHGDANSISILNKLTTSDKMYGEEAKMASSALLKTAEETTLVPDYSQKKSSKK